MELRNSRSGSDERIVVEPATLINLCRKHNDHILQLLDIADHKVDVSELVNNTVQIQFLLSRCTSDYGDLKNLDVKVVERVYVSICKYERKIQRLQKQGALAKIISQARLRGQIDQLSNRIVLQVEETERHIRSNLLKQLGADKDDVFNVLVKQITMGLKLEEEQQLKGIFKEKLDSEKKLKNRETKQMLDNALSIVPDPVARGELLSNIPSLKVLPLRSNTELVNLISPGDETEVTFGDFVCARSISTYPLYPNGVREGEPICDMYAISCMDNRTLIALADGCSWGRLPKEAARRASRMFVAYMKSNQIEMINTTSDAASLILRAYYAAHKAILHKLDESDDTFGSTTMLAGIILELAEPDPKTGSRFAFVFASVGDCKAYLYSAKTGKVDEITKGNRGGRDLRDPGGRLGPHETDDPDLRNLRVVCTLCNESDLITIVSDGVHDNFDPEVAGKTPSEVGISVPDDNWNTIKDFPTDTQKEAVYNWSIGCVQNLLNRPVTAKSISRELLSYSKQISSKTRDFYENHPKEKPPPDYTLYPGKLDHSTCVTVKVGNKSGWIRGSASADTTKMNLRASFSGNAGGPGAWRKSLSMNESPGQDLRSSKKFSELLKQDLSEKSPEIYQNNSAVKPAAAEDAFDPQRAVWDGLFGTEAYLVSWRTFIQGLGFPLKEEEENQLRSIIDHSKTGSVTRYKFVEFLKGFGPLSSCLKNMQETVQLEFFHGYLSSNEAKLFLEQQPTGAFLLRFSGSRPGAFVLDWVVKLGHIRSVRIDRQPEGGFSALTEGGDQQTFPSLKDLVDIYTSKGVLTTPFSSSLTKQPWFFGDLTREEGEDLLQGQAPGTFLIRFATNQIGCFSASFVGTNNTVLRGLITPAGGGYQVNSKGMIFSSLVDVVKHYQDSGYFLYPLTNYKVKYRDNA
eukprot:TRINITY_DN171_c1_g2_i1.p1 TRINITY_DN171_c1_g2~~TRINITY_DN171_c1_g2_i1.p1  ORF type:complete len:915 (+),score=253.68 TRINITY_DN171_c1_g2_i1:218-2962(+)